MHRPLSLMLACALAVAAACARARANDHERSTSSGATSVPTRVASATPTPTPEPGSANPREATGSSTAPRAPTKRRIVIHGAGDVLVHDRVDLSARAFAGNEDARTGGFGRVFASLRPSLARGDLNLVNMETPMAIERNAPRMDPPVLNARPEVAAALALVGFHGASVANNHAYDQTRAGLGETALALRDAGIAPLGVDLPGRERSATVFVRNGVRVAVLAFTDVSNGSPRRVDPTLPLVARYDDAGETLQAIRAERDTSDLVVVFAHWGAELEVEPNTRQREIARAVCEAGADILFGAHSHTLQRVERREVNGRTCVIAYSLGNLVSNQGLRYHPRPGHDPPPRDAADLPETRDGLLLRVGYELGERFPRLTTLEAVPLFTWNNWRDRFRDGDSFVHDIHIVTHRELRDSGRYNAVYAERSAYVRGIIGDAVLVDE